MFLRTAFVATAFALAAPVFAAPEDDLIEALGVPQMVQIMREEGQGYGADLGRDMLPGGSDAAWEAVVDRIYDTDAMLETVRAGFAEEIEGTDLDPLLDYFTSDAGARIVGLVLGATLVTALVAVALETHRTPCASHLVAVPPQQGTRIAADGGPIELEINGLETRHVGPGRLIGEHLVLIGLRELADRIGVRIVSRGRRAAERCQGQDSHAGCELGRNSSRHRSPVPLSQSAKGRAPGAPTAF